MDDDGCCALAPLVEGAGRRLLDSTVAAEALGGCLPGDQLVAAIQGRAGRGTCMMLVRMRALGQDACARGYGTWSTWRMRRRHVPVVRRASAGRSLLFSPLRGRRTQVAVMPRAALPVPLPVHAHTRVLDQQVLQRAGLQAVRRVASRLVYEDPVVCVSRCRLDVVRG